MQTGRKIRLLDGEGQGIAELAFRPDNGLLAVAWADWVFVYGREDVEPVASYGVEANRIGSVRFSPSGRGLEVVWDRGGEFARLDPLTGQVLQRSPAPGGHVTSAVAVSGQRTVAGTVGRSLLFWALPEEAGA